MGFPSLINLEKKTPTVLSCWSSGQQQQVQNAANVLAQALELGPAQDAGEAEEAEEPKIVTTD